MATLFFAAVLVHSAIGAHPSHESFSEVEWNAETGRLEVALRFDALDEQWLKKQRKETGKHEEWAMDYVRQTYRMSEPPKEDRPDSTRYHWIGREEDGPHVWWYFEIEPNDRRPPQWLDVRVLFEREKNYVHQFVRLDTKPRYSGLLSVQTPRKSFSPPNKRASNTRKPVENKTEISVDGSNTRVETKATTDR